MMPRMSTSNLSGKPRSWKQLLPVVLVIALFTAGWWQVSAVAQARLIAEQRAELQKETDEIASILTSDINRRQSQLLGLATTVKTHSLIDLRSGHFYAYVSGLVGDDPRIRVVQFFPVEGTVLLYPTTGNEGVLNGKLDDLRYTSRANVRADLQRTIESGQITLSDPYELVQGGKGVVARLAIYTSQKELLGIVAIVLNLNPLLDVHGLHDNGSGTDYAIRDMSGQVFYGDANVFTRSPVEAEVILPEGTWTIAAVPTAGWRAATDNTMCYLGAFGVTLALLLGLLTYMLSTRQASLRKQVAERTAELAVSQERYSTALNMVNQGIWDWDGESKLTYASSNSFKLLGYAEEGPFPPPEALLALIHPDDQERVIAEMRRGMQSSEPFTVELRAGALDGRWVIIQVCGRVVERGPDGQALRMAGTLVDVTERRQAEARLLEEQAKFYALYENNHAPMMMLTPGSGEIVDANPAACRFYGWTREEIIGKKISDINTLSEAEVKVELSRALREERRFFQFRHRLANQEIRDVEVFSGPIQHNGKTALYSIIHDVTARRQAERALAESEERYRQLLEMAPVGIVVHLDGRFIFVNPAAVRLLGGESTGQLIGKQISDFVSPEQMDRTLQRLARLDAGEAGVYPAENVLVRLDGTSFNADVIVSRLVYQGKPAYQAIIVDINERKKTEEKIHAAQAELKRLLDEADSSRQVLLSVIEDQKLAEEQLNQLNAELEQRVAERTAQLEAANKELEAFSYSVSHDLRAPLRGIDGWSLALQEDFASLLDEKGRQYIERVRSETQRMGQLIDDLLRLSRVTRVEMHPTQVNLSGLAAAIAARLQEENPDRQVEFSIQPEIYVQGDEQLLEIVLTNLLSNAVKFTGRQPLARVVFGREEREGETIYFVRDNGAGFDKAFAGKLFGAFQRMHKQSEFPGNGVGLATVQRIVNRHGGKVWAEAEKNLGAVFFFTLFEER